MTAVIGLLNKHGVAIAADSAVTRTRRKQMKITKNGNKMLRLSNAVPVSVMLTGNGDYCCTQWDIIIRYFRECRGQQPYPTVEACAHGFFDFIAEHGLFCEKELQLGFIQHVMDQLYDHALNNVSNEAKEEQANSYCLQKPRKFQKELIRSLEAYARKFTKLGRGPQFADYTQEQFEQFAGETVKDFLIDRTDMLEEDPEPLQNALKEPFTRALLALLTTHYDEMDGIATLVFSGYGTEQEYPSLVSADVWEGFDNRVNYYIDPQKVICISDERPSAICPFAQQDVISSLLKGIYLSSAKAVGQFADEQLRPWNEDLFPNNDDSISWGKFNIELDDVPTEDLFKHFADKCNRQLARNYKQWEKTIADYDLPSMAALAYSLIQLTGFQRILTFQDEGVGGPVDLAVINKLDGFVWMSRKSWYHHKDVGGQYGSMGV